MNNFQDYKAYLLYMENNYDEEDQITIENFISYYMNKYRGFGQYNCEYAYQAELKNDVTGKLHEFAMIGFNFEKKKYNERKLKSKHLKSHRL
jgi:hypothetical protein